MNLGELLTVVLISFGLAMDCFAVSVARGTRTKEHKLKTALMLSISFGAFQAVMPLIGWALGEEFINQISGYDHWIAFALLALVGCRMIYESLRAGGGVSDSARLTLFTLLVLSIATSIDAFAVGLTFAFLNIEIISAALIIGVVSFLLSYAGFFLGCRVGNLCGKKAEIAGGLILLAIGLKILIEHLT